MDQDFINSAISKLILLEQRMGSNVHYRIMTPLSTPFHDYVTIQALAKSLAEFIGLDGFTYIISVAKQGQKVAGHIELSSDPTNVFIEIDTDIMQFPNAVAATLCHEICHKWLDVNNIRLAGAENEILTDMCSIFLGFGKIMLNGCKNSLSRFETTANESRTITETLNTGYIDRQQLAFVYRIVGAMRKIPFATLTNDLDDDALSAVQQCDSLCGDYFRRSFHTPEPIQNIVCAFNQQLIENQQRMAELDKHLTYIKKSLCDTTNEFIVNSHNSFDLSNQKTAAMIDVYEPDPALQFLLAVQNHIEVTELMKKLYSVKENTETLLRNIEAIARAIPQCEHFPALSSSMFNVVRCPKDGTLLRLPENSGNLIATCPKCRYRFAYNTNVPLFSTNKPPRWRRVLQFLWKHM